MPATTTATTMAAPVTALATATGVSGKESTPPTHRHRAPCLRHTSPMFARRNPQTAPGLPASRASALCRCSPSRRCSGTWNRMGADLYSPPRRRLCGSIDMNPTTCSKVRKVHPARRLRVHGGRSRKVRFREVYTSASASRRVDHSIGMERRRSVRFGVLVRALTLAG